MFNLLKLPKTEAMERKIKIKKTKPAETKWFNELVKEPPLDLRPSLRDSMGSCAEQV